MPHENESAITFVDSLRAAEATLGEQDPLETALAFQLRLTEAISQLLTDEKQVINRIPADKLGEHRVLPTKPLSTTSEVLFTEDGLALKIFSFPDFESQSFNPNDHGLYLMIDARVRLMSAAGEVAIGTLMNQGAQGEPLYYGVGVIEVGSENSVTVSQLTPEKLNEVVAGEAEICIVMRKMSGTYLDIIRGIHEGTANISETEFADKAEHMLEQLLRAATPLEPQHAAELGSPERTKKTITQDTPAWLAYGRSEEEYSFGALAQAGSDARAAIATLSTFFELPETPARLADRAVPSKTRDGKTTMVQSYSSGDPKTGNILFDAEGNAFFSDGLSLVVKTDKVPGNPEPVFAPWAFNDIMQSAAYFVLEAKAYNLDEVYERVKGRLRAYVSQTEDWTPWHDAYFDVLISYKLLVEAACAVDNYLDQCDPETRQVLPTMEPHTQKKVEEYPVIAAQLARQALADYERQLAISA